ncbi:MAG: HD domain-containing phosphohydrolase [Candidatus Hydrogenedentota bacterium]
MANERLVALAGERAGQTFAIDGVFTLGRTPESTLQFTDDLQVSRRHARIEQTDRGTMLRDEGSGNGTYVGNRRVIEYRLKHGDVLCVGAQQFRFESDAPEAKPDAASRARPGSSVKLEVDASQVMEAADADSLRATFFAPGAPAKEGAARDIAEQRLQALYAANQVIASERDLQKVFEEVMDQLFRLLPAHNGVILLREQESGELVTECVRSGRPNVTITISSSIVERAVNNGEALITHNAAADSRFDMGGSIISQGITSAMCAPLKYQDSILGVIYLDTRGTSHAFTRNDLHLLVTLAGPAAVAIRNAQYVSELERSYEDTLTVLANSIEMRDHYTVGHTWRVTNFSMAIGRELGWDNEKLKECEMGGVLHDVGKIGVPDAILCKPDRLTDAEYQKMKVHPERGARLLQDVAHLHPLIPYCLYHHERYDGKGYPYGLAGNEIPLEGRVLAVADAFDALTSNRPYRKGLDSKVAIAEIEKGKGTQFDPVVADAFIRLYQEGRVHRILQDYLKKDEKSIACPFCSTFIQMPEGAQQGDEFDCGVCHRRLRLQVSNEAYFGELLPQHEMMPQHRGGGPS